MSQYLIAGNSHTTCLRAAAAEFSNVDVVNLKEDRYVNGELGQLSPDMVCLSISGNTHNFLALFEHPIPYTTAGLTLDDKDRVSIPVAQLRRFFSSRLHHILSDTKKMHATFPNARFAYLCAPPPLAISETISYIPKTFESVAEQGVGPTELRLFLHQLQTEYYVALAQTNGATFIAPPAEALTDEGLLAVPYSGRDPTHGNIDYGSLVLQQVFQWGER